MNRTLKASKEEFKRYKLLQELGIMNMLDKQVQEYTGITQEQHQDIIVNYNDYMEERE